MAKKIRFLVKKMDSSKRSETPEKSVNKIQKDIAVEFLNFIGGMDALVDAMIAVQKKGAEGIRKGSPADFKLIVRNVLADGDLVAVHTQLSSSNPNNGGLRQVHLFRFSDDKIVEYWDITQQVLENAPNAAGAFS